MDPAALADYDVWKLFANQNLYERFLPSPPIPAVGLVNPSPCVHYRTQRILKLHPNKFDTMHAAELERKRVGLKIDC